jgi:hypothetical protein
MDETPALAAASYQARAFRICTHLYLTQWIIDSRTGFLSTSTSAQVICGFFVAKSTNANFFFMRHMYICTILSQCTGLDHFAGTAPDGSEFDNNELLGVFCSIQKRLVFTQIAQDFHFFWRILEKIWRILGFLKYLEYLGKI